MGGIATGIAALVVLSGLLHGTVTRRGLWVFTALGLGDFVVALIAAAVAQPEAMATLPLVLFPTVAVPWFSVLHLLALAQAGDLPAAAPARRRGQNATAHSSQTP